MAITDINEDDSIFDSQGFRFNVGIMLINRANKVFCARRIGSKDTWQMPQGGMRADEQAKNAALRELTEETGIKVNQVEILTQSKNYLQYRLPVRFQHRRKTGIRCIGQKQRWFLMRFIDEDDSNIDPSSVSKPEFDTWEWAEYWKPLERVVHFKRDVYQAVLLEFAQFLNLSTQIPSNLRYRPKNHAYYYRSTY